MARAAAPYIHAKISPENTKMTNSLGITLAQLVLGSYELEAAEKAKQIEGQVVKQVPAEWNDDSQQRLNNAPTI